MNPFRFSVSHAKAQRRKDHRASPFFAPLRLCVRLLSLFFFSQSLAHAAAIRASNDPVKDERPITAKDREHWAWKPLMKVDAADLDAVVPAPA